MENYVIYPKQIRRKIIPVEKNACFFLMPFSPEFNIIYGSIKNRLTDLGYSCQRADEISGSLPIMSKILKSIMKSQYIIVDLTNSNPNVFYELGIAHTLKEARNVLLIKQKNYNVPFDISHLTYIDYEPTNLLLLLSTIEKFLNDSSTVNNLYNALNYNKLISFIDDNDNDLIELLQVSLQDQVEILSKTLLGEYFDLGSVEIASLIDKLLKIIIENNQEDGYKLQDLVVNVLIKLIVALPESENNLIIVNSLLNEFFEIHNCRYDLTLIYKTNLALQLAEHKIYIESAMSWIILYFSRSKSTTIDLNRYKIENFLMTSESEQVNEFIINALCNKDCYIREHMSDIIGEKKLVLAEKLLIKQLEKEENYFTAQSMMEAIGKINAKGGINSILKWVDAHCDSIVQTNQLFVLKHALNSIRKLDATIEKRYVKIFESKYGDLIKNYYII